MPVTVISKIKQKNNSDFAIVDDIDMNGGLRIVATIADRNAIQDSRKKNGMLVRVQADGIVYELLPDLTTWAAWSGSSAPEILIYALETTLLGDPQSNGKIGYAEDTNGTFIRAEGTWTQLNVPANVDGGTFL
jgi:hypothetical protein